MLRLRGIIGIAGIVVLIAAASSATAGQQAATAGQGFKVVGKWGRAGSGNSQFANANGIAVSKAGLVYVADSDNHRVQVFSPTGAFRSKWGTEGGNNGQFEIAEDVEIAPDGTVWVADQQNSRIQAFSATGAFKTAFEMPDGLPRAVGVAQDGSVIEAHNGSRFGGFRRWVEKPTGWELDGGLKGGGEYRADEAEGSPDGTIYIVTSSSQVPYDVRIRRYAVDGKALGSFKRGDSTPLAGIGIDLDCNIWSPDHPNRRIVKYSPSGRVLATAASPDLVAKDVAVSPKGDLYALENTGSVIHFAADRKKPATAKVPAQISVKGGKATIPYAGTFACPAQVTATATLKGPGVSGNTTTKITAGKTTPIAMTVHGPAGKTVKATFTIVLRTNGRPTTEQKPVQVSFSK